MENKQLVVKKYILSISHYTVSNFIRTISFMKEIDVKNIVTALYFKSMEENCTAYLKTYVFNWSLQISAFSTRISDSGSIILYF